MKKEWLVKTLAMCIVVLFVSVSYHPIIAENTIAVEKESDYNNVDFEEAKEYLFQTLIEISKNPEVKELIKQNNQMMFTSYYDYKDVFSQLFIKKSGLLNSIIFNRPKMTFKYLEKSYNNGIELINILGEEKSLKIVESVDITNPELFKKLNDIIENNDELSNRISVLGKINIDLKSNLVMLERFPIICNISFHCLFAGLIFCMAFSELIFNSDISILIKIIMAPLYFLCTLPVWFTLYLMLFLHCDFPDITPPY